MDTWRAVLSQLLSVSYALSPHSIPPFHRHLIFYIYIQQQNNNDCNCNHLVVVGQHLVRNVSNTASLSSWELAQAIWIGNTDWEHPSDGKVTRSFDINPQVARGE